MAVTFAETMAQAARLALALDHLDVAYNSASPNFLGKLDTYEQSYEGNYIAARAASVAAIAAAAGSALSQNSVQAAFLPILFDAAEAMGASGGDAISIFRRVYAHFVDNNHTVKSSTITYDTPNANAANTGNIDIVQLSVDENGHAIQGVHFDTQTARCVQDQNSEGSNKEAEVFELFGAPADKNSLRVFGVGNNNATRLQVSSALDSQAIVANPSFDEGQFSGTTITSLTNWTLAGANFETDTTLTYRSYNGASTDRSLKLIGNDTFSQIPAAVKSTRFRNVPYLVQIAIYPSADLSVGTLTLRLGAVTRAIDLSTLTAGAWNVVRLLATPGQNYWPKNFREDSLTVSGALTNLTGTSVNVDDLMVVPFTQFDQLWYCAVPSAAAPVSPKLEDEYTWTNTTSARGSLQYWLGFRAGLGHLPHTANATQITAAGGRTFTFADANPDTLTLSSGTLSSDGYAVGMKIVIAGTTSNNGTYTIAALAATVITIATGEAFAAEGPLSATATLDGTPTFVDDPDA